MYGNYLPIFMAIINLKKIEVHENNNVVNCE